MNNNNWRELLSTLWHVFGNPALLLLGIVWSVMAVGLVLWLPNIELAREVLDSEALGPFTKIKFWLEVYQLLLAQLGIFQVVITIVFAILAGIGAGLLAHVLGLVHQQRITRDQCNTAILTNVLGGGIAMIGLALLTPVVTVSGLVFGVNLHLVGVLLSLCGIGLLGWANIRLIKCLPTIL